MGLNSPRQLRRLFFDIETSPNIVFSWSVGYKLRIDYANIIKERAIICICWKWEGDKKVSSLTWNEGDDKEMLTSFAKVIDSADEVIGHNSDNFDLKWLRTRFVLHGIPASPNIRGVDTLKLARRGFRFNSNRLDYIGEFLGFGGKIKTEYNLWKSIVLDNDVKSLEKMVRYCKRDVQLLEQVYQKIESYHPHRTHAGVIAGGMKSDCPKCASKNTQRKGFLVTAGGIKKQRVFCQDCGRNFTISNAEALRKDQEKWAEMYAKEPTV
jgi:hypothetical protein